MIREPMGRVEDADVHSSSNEYAQRFSGAVGAWFLEVQACLTLELLRSLPQRLRILDVGGGHAQLVPHLVSVGHAVEVLGSAPVCGRRIEAWTASRSCRFRVGSLSRFPYEDGEFDVGIAFRMLPHVTAWEQFIAELCRVSSLSVIVDFPSSRSINRISEPLFNAKKLIEGDTRHFRLFSPASIRENFAAHGFRTTASKPQYLLPMVLHRMLRARSIAKALEQPGRVTGLTRWFGSPVIIRADRL